MTAWPRSIRRITAFTLLAFALALMGLFALWPHINGNFLQKKLTEVQAQLTGAETVTSEGEGLLSRNNLLAKTNKKSKLLLSGATIGIAGANLQELILNYVARNGGVVSQIQVLPPVQELELIRIPVSLNLTTDTKGLRDIIVDLETNYSLLYIRDLVVNRANQDSKSGQGNGRHQGRVLLNISMRIFGYVGKGSSI